MKTIPTIAVDIEVHELLMDNAKQFKSNSETFALNFKTFEKCFKSFKTFKKMSHKF